MSFLPKITPECGVGVRTSRPAWLPNVSVFKECLFVFSLLILGSESVLSATRRRAGWLQDMVKVSFTAWLKYQIKVIINTILHYFLHKSSSRYFTKFILIGLPTTLPAPLPFINGFRTSSSGSTIVGIVSWLSSTSSWSSKGLKNRLKIRQRKIIPPVIIRDSLHP